MIKSKKQDWIITSQIPGPWGYYGRRWHPIWIFMEFSNLSEIWIVFDWFSI